MWRLSLPGTSSQLGEELFVNASMDVGLERMWDCMSLPSSFVNPSFDIHFLSFPRSQVSHHEKLVEMGVAMCPMWSWELHKAASWYILLTRALGTHISQKLFNQGRSPRIEHQRQLLSVQGTLEITLLRQPFHTGAKKQKIQSSVSSSLQLSVLPFSFNFVSFLPVVSKSSLLYTVFPACV